MRARLDRLRARTEDATEAPKATLRFGVYAVVGMVVTLGAALIALAAGFVSLGYDIISGGTDNHLILADVWSSFAISGGEAETLLSFAQVQALVLRELVEPLRKRAEVLLEQAAAGVFDESLHERERLQLVRREPEARQLERFAGLGSTVLVAAGVGVEDDGRVQVVLQGVDGAEHGAFRAFELRHQLFERDGRAPLRENDVELEDSVELVHLLLFLLASRIHTPLAAATSTRGVHWSGVRSQRVTPADLRCLRDRADHGRADARRRRPRRTMPLPSPAER